MRLLLDTHLLLWAAARSRRLSVAARRLIADADNDLLFSAASFREVAIKHSPGRADFRVDARLLKRGLLDNDQELSISSEHASTTEGLPPLHKDPFDRLLLAQAITEGVTLLTSDATVAGYPAPVRKV